MIRTIAFVSQKGGSGKTTLCAHLAIAAERTGAGPVDLIDTDPQATLAAWRDRRTAHTPRRLDGPDARTILDAAGQLTPAPRYILIDTPPTDGPQTLAVARLADLVVVPVRPSAADLWSVAATIDRLERARIPFLFAITQARAGAGVTAQVAAALSHYGPVAPVIQYARTIYAAALTDGRTALELARTGPAALETIALWRAIVARIDSFNTNDSRAQESATA